LTCYLLIFYRKDGKIAMCILVISAHPDDEVLGCGGTIVKLIKKGHEVFIAILGEGITSRFDKQEQTDLSQVYKLHDKSKKVAKYLGAKDLFFMNLPDNRFDTIPLLDIVKKIENLIEKTKPEIVYTHHGGDLNIDHNITFRATITATRPMKGCTVKELYTYEVPSSTEWAFGKFNQAFQPNVFVDISNTLENKIFAMKIYDEEVRQFPHPRSTENVIALAQKWGSSVGLLSAEAFELVRYIC